MSRQIEIRQPEIIIVGGGPAGLMAADRLSACPNLRVTVYDAMPSLGRKFLMAGVGGMNITHSEAGAIFLSRYGPRAPDVAPWLADFGPQAIREWMHGLGIESFVGSSGKVFPRDMKAAPLLRVWLQRLRQRGVRFKVRQRWLGWQGAQADGRLRFQTPAGEAAVRADAVLFALGGGSWPQLGSDAAIEAADVVLMDDDPMKIAKAIKISRKCLGIVYQNIVFAIGVKLICLLLGALGIANMWLAIFADVGVMIIAVLNAIRALFVKNL